MLNFLVQYYLNHIHMGKHVVLQVLINAFVNLDLGLTGQLTAYGPCRPQLKN